MNSREIGQIKYDILLKFLDNPSFVSLVDANHEAEYPEDLMYVNLFPYGRIPNTEQEVRVYVTVTVNVPSINRKNDLIRDISIKIRVYAHENLMRVPGEKATRIDLISSEIDSMLNETYGFGIGYVTLVSNTEHTLDSRHQFRELVFKTDGINSKRKGAEQWDS